MVVVAVGRVVAVTPSVRELHQGFLPGFHSGNYIITPKVLANAAELVQTPSELRQIVDGP
jgi:hypothetical protein